MDQGVERIGDAQELQRVRAQAAVVHLKSGITAVLLTLATFLLPGG